LLQRDPDHCAAYASETHLHAACGAHTTQWRL
jgi:hypothetical protein